MQSQKIWLGVIGVSVLLAGALFLYKGGSMPSNAQTGRVVFAVTDAVTSVMNATSIVVTIDKVEAQSSTEGWVTVGSASKQYDLLKLKASGASELLADVNLPVGTYNQVRLNISRAEVAVDGKTEQAKLPSNTLKIVGKVVVNAGATAAVTLDFLADKSLHITGNGQYILAPVVKLESRSDADVQIASDNKVVVTGGRVETDATFGMDEKGELKVDFELKGRLDVDAGNIINLGGDNRSDNQKFEVTLNTENNSGLSGKATFSEEGGKVKVKLELVTNVLGMLSVANPAHIHVGVCPGVGAVKYPLSSVVNGKSETTIDATLAELRAQLPLAVNIHKSVAQVGTYVACGAVNL